MTILEHNYALYIVIWLVISFLALLIFRVFPRKMKETSDRETKSSLFTIMIVLGLPLLMAAVLGPLVFLIGDKDMDSTYRIIWGVLVFVFIIYFIFKQRSQKTNI